MALLKDTVLFDMDSKTATTFLESERLFDMDSKTATTFLESERLVTTVWRE